MVFYITFEYILNIFTYLYKSCNFYVIGYTSISFDVTLEMFSKAEYVTFSSSYVSFGFLLLFVAYWLFSIMLFVDSAMSFNIACYWPWWDPHNILCGFFSISIFYYIYLVNEKHSKNQIADQCRQFKIYSIQPVFEDFLWSLN